MSRAASLLQLQGIDLELDAHRARLSAIEAALGDDPVVRAAQHEVVEATTAVHNARVAVQNLDYENQTLAEKLAEVDGRMYSGAINNAKVLQDLQNEAASLQRRRAALEEKQFEALLGAESAETHQAEAQHRLERAEAAGAETHGSLRDERQRLTATVARLETNRAAALAAIPAADMELYTHLRQTKRGRAVAQLDEDACSACGVAPSSSRIQDARQGTQLVLCGNCGRILCAD